MGDTFPSPQHDRGSILDNTQLRTPHGAYFTTESDLSMHHLASSSEPSPESGMQSFYAQYAALPLHHPHLFNTHPGTNTAPFPYPIRNAAGFSSSFGMENMAAALPDAHAISAGYPPQLSTPHSPGQTYMQQQHIQFSPQARSIGPMTFDSCHPYMAQFPGQMHPAYSMYAQQQANPAMYSPYAYTDMRAMHQFMGQEEEETMAHQVYPQFVAICQPQSSKQGRVVSARSRDLSGAAKMFMTSALNGPSGEAVLPNDISRGPPRKPRQSGHALWVGNLPPGATVIDLKDFFSRGATHEIESVKLISKSNCAFVNYRTEAACMAAMTRFHDSRLHGNRLVCRLRRSSIGSSGSSQSAATLQTPPDSSGGVLSPVSDDEGNPTRRAIPERFFVLKSLTVQDVEASVKTGIWATQAHNEAALNDAFKHAQNVYLFFSANKSGEYFGYARMISGIIAPPEVEEQTNYASPTDLENSLGFPLTRSNTQASGYDIGPKDIPTTATQWAPKGRIIDDLARGTIFWEADLEDDSDGMISNGTPSSGNTPPEPTTSPDEDTIIVTSTPHLGSPPREKHDERASFASTAMDEVIEPSSGNAFHVEWLSTRRVPFYKTRGLRNPWNTNREVKIARDGTELETEVGKKLLALFGAPTMRQGQGQGRDRTVLN